MRTEGLKSPRRRDRTSGRARLHRVRPSAERLEGRALLTISIEPRPEFVAYTGQPDRLVAATFTDSDHALTAGDFAATIDWGDGTTSAGDIAEGADGTFRVSALKTYAQPGSYWLGRGSYPVTVTISSPVNGDLASTAEVDSELLESLGEGADPGSSRGIAEGDRGQYIADPKAGGVVDYDNVAGGTPLIAVPGPGGGASSPTGVAVLPGATDELVIVTSDGTIAVWTNPGGFGALPPGQAATTVVDHSASGADYEGVTTGTIPAAGGGTESVIFVANFADGRIEAYDAGTFAPVDPGAGGFADPSLPAGYAPLNVRDIDGTVYVAYAEQSGTKGRAVDGAGKGFVDSFDQAGHLLARFSTPGGFDAPSGIALAPADMGVYAGYLLVANTGDGTLSVLDPSNPSAPAAGLPGVLGRVAGPGGGPLAVAGLWGLSTETYHEFGSTYTYLYDSSDASDAEVGSFFYNPTLAEVLAPPSTGITNAPPGLVAFLGDPSHDLQFGQFIDADGAVDGSDAAELSVTIDWGDGSAPAAGTLTFESGENFPSGADYILGGTAPYTATGSYTVTVTVAVAGGPSYTVHVPVTVVDGTSPVVEPVPGVALPGGGTTPAGPDTLQAFSIGAYTGDPAEGFTVAQFFDFDGTADGSNSSRLSATIDWGDGSTPTAGTLTFQAYDGLGPNNVTDYYIDGTHHYDAAGTFTAEVTVAMAGGSTYTVHVPVTVRDGTHPDPITDPTGPGFTTSFGPVIVPFSEVQGVATAPTSGELGSFAAPTGTYTVSVDWGDGSTPSTGLVVPGLLPAVGAAGDTSYTILGPASGHSYAAPGTYTVTFDLRGPGGSSTKATTTAVIAPARMVLRANPIDIGTVQGQALDAGLATFTYDGSASLPTSDFVVMVDWRDGSPATLARVELELPPGGTATPFYAVFASHTYHTAGHFTPYINVVAPDAESQWAAARVTVAADPAGPSNVLSDGTFPAARGIATVDGLLATFSAPAGSYTAIVAWGDGSSPSDATVTPIGGGAGGLTRYAVRGSHTFARTGDFQAIVAVVAANGDIGWGADRFHVVPPAGAPTDLTTDPVPGYRGIALDARLAAFIGGDLLGGRYTATVNWGDGSASVPADVEGLPVPQVIVPGVPPPPDTAVTGSHTYARAGTYTITLHIVDPDGSSTWTTTRATIAAPPSGPVDFGTRSTAGAVQYVNTAGIALAGFAAASDASDTAAIDWGDGSAPTFATIVPDGSTATGGTFTTRNLPDFEIKGSHTYARTGTYKALIHLLGPGGVSEWTSNTVAVTPGAPLFDGPLGQQGRAQTFGTLTFFAYQTPPFPSPPASSFTAVIDWADGSPLTFGTVTVGQGLPTPIGVPLSETLVISGTHTYLTPGHYLVGVALMTPDGETAKTNVGVLVTPNSSGPTFLAPVAVLGTQGMPLSGATVATFGLLPGSADGYVAAVDWGDGTASGPGVVAASGASGRLVTGSHTYAAPGTYRVQVEVLRSDGESDWVSTQATIAPATPAVAGGLVSGATTSTPTYAGTAPAGTVVGLYARPSGVTGMPALLGTATAGLDGRWSITSSPLLPGSYDVAALDTNPFTGGSAAALFGTLEVAPTPVPTGSASPVASFGALAWARQIADRARFF